jgi:hypothetical protein
VPAAFASRGATPPSQALAGKNSAAEFPQELSWSHYLVLTRVVKPTARAFYEIEAARQLSCAVPDRRAARAQMDGHTRSTWRQ